MTTFFLPTCTLYITSTAVVRGFFGFLFAGNKRTFESLIIMMKKSMRGSTCLGHLEKFKTLLPCKEVLEGANSTPKPANILLVIDDLDMCQEHLKSTQNYVDHCILKPWNDRQDMFITCSPTSESGTVNGLKILSVLSALAYKKR